MTIEREENATELQRTLPREFYRSEETFGEERERIFWREWFCAGREEALPSPGDYLSIEVAGQTVLIVRDRAGGLGAFYTCVATAAPSS